MLLERRVYHTNILSYYDYSVKKIIFAGPNGFNIFLLSLDVNDLRIESFFFRYETFLAILFRLRLGDETCKVIPASWMAQASEWICKTELKLII